MNRYKAVLSILVLASTSCFSMFGDSNSTLIKSSSNFARTKKAVLLKNEGNATVGLSFQVSILDSEYKLTGKETGNTFTVDRNYVTSGLDSTSINFNWISNDTLQIVFDHQLRTFIQKTKVNGITIIYKAL